MTEESETLVKNHDRLAGLFADAFEGLEAPLLPLVMATVLGAVLVSIKECVGRAETEALLRDVLADLGLRP